MKAIAMRPTAVVSRALDLLAGEGVRGCEARVLVVGASYKPGVRDVREAPAVRIMRELAEEGVAVSYHDPLVRSLEVDDQLALLSVPQPRPSDYDLALVVTLHDHHDYELAGRLRPGARLHVPDAAGADEGTDLVAGLSTAGRLRTREPIPWFNLALRAVCALYLAVIVTAVLAYKTVFIEIVVEDPWFGVYSVVVCAFIMSRFLFSLFYRPVPHPPRGAARADDRGRDAGLQRGGRGGRLDQVAADRRLPPREARDRRHRRRLHRRHPGRDRARRRRERLGARDLLPGEPRQAGRDGGRHPRHVGGRSSPSSTPTARSNATRCGASCAASRSRRWARSPVTPRCRTRASRGSRACRRCATSSRSASARRRSRSSARSRAARAASPPTAARRSPRCSSAGRTSASWVARRPTATTAR